MFGSDPSRRSRPPVVQRQSRKRRSSSSPLFVSLPGANHGHRHKHCHRMSAENPYAAIVAFAVGVKLAHPSTQRLAGAPQLRRDRFNRRPLRRLFGGHAPGPIRTARSRTSGEYLLGRPIEPILSTNGPSDKPGTIQSQRRRHHHAASRASVRISLTGWRAVRSVRCSRRCGLPVSHLRHSALRCLRPVTPIPLPQRVPTSCLQSDGQLIGSTQPDTVFAG